MRKMVEGMSAISAGLSADLLAYRFAWIDLVFAFLVGAVAFCERCFSSTNSGILESILSSCLLVEIYLCFKLMLPMMLFVRVGDMFRCRFAFYLVCATGALSVLDHGPIPSLVFASESYLPQLVVVGWIVLCAMMFVRTGSRALLSVAYFAIGGLTATGPIGLVALLLVWLVNLSVRVRLLGYIPIDPDVELASKDGYSEFLAVVARCNNCMRNSRILCALSLIIGAAVILTIKTWIFSDSDKMVAFESLLRSYGLLGSFLLKMDFIVPLMATGALLFVALHFSRQATDVLEPLKGGLMLLFGIVLLVSLVWSTGVIWTIDPFSTMKPVCIIPEIFSAMALVVSVSVFVVELGCRNYLIASYGMDEYLHRAPSRRIKNLRVFGLVVAVLIIVKTIPRFVGL